MKPIVFAALAFALAACSSTPSWLGGGEEKAVDPNIFPADYRREILDTMRSALTDVNKVRDAGISDPQLVAIDQEQRYAVCVRANSRDEYGRYPGPKDRIGYFYGGHITQLIDAKPEQCARAAYKPFPELEQLCIGKGCAKPR